MQWAERGAIAVALLLTGFAHADAPGYGKVETFQPGKKYNCVPTADHKAWDCSESGKAAPQQPRDEAPAAAPSPSSAPAPAEATPKASALPSYLTRTNAGSAATPIASPPPPAAAAPTSAPEPMAEPISAPAAPIVEPTPSPTRRVSPPAAVAPQPAEAKPSAPPAAPSPVKRPATPAAAENSTATATVASTSRPVADAATPGPNDFLALPGDKFVIELARADAAGELDAPAVPRGKVYKLHLRQNGAGRWLLLWGPFDSVESARTARDEIAAQGATPGWPRRVAPLQAEARRNSE